MRKMWGEYLRRFIMIGVFWTNMRHFPPVLLYSKQVYYGFMLHKYSVQSSAVGLVVPNRFVRDLSLTSAGFGVLR